MTEIFAPTITLNDDREMPQLGLGTYKLNGAEGERVIRDAISLGYRKLDTATLYGNEEIVGKAIAGAIKAGDVTRDELFITTKVWHDHHGADKVPVAFQESLSKLGLDYIDLYLVHWPWPQGGKYAETFVEMARLQGMGQIASIGVANFYEEVLDVLIQESGIVPVLNQVEMHPGFSQPELREYHRQHDIVTEAWSPLGRGEVLSDPDLKAVAAAAGVTEGQATLAYLLQLGASVVPKSTSKERLAENLAAVNVELNREQMAAIDALDSKPGYGRMFGDPRVFPDSQS